MPQDKDSALNAAQARPVLQAIARMISTDRRIAILATEKAEILLSNAPASQLRLDMAALKTTFSWPTLCTRAQRSGSVAVSTLYNATQLEGEMVHLSLGNADAFLLRLVATDQEAVQLQNRARAATLLRVAHDLRTPIQSVLASTEAFFDHSSTTKASNPRAAGVEKSAQLALAHIEKVIRVIRGELTSAELQADEDFDLAQEARDIIDMIKPIVAQRHATVTLSVEPEDQIWLNGPVHLVRALLQNMFDNSGKHGGEAVDIRVVCAPLSSRPETEGPKEHAITIEVADKGGGIPEAQKARLLGTSVEDENEDRAKSRRADRTTAGMSVLAHAIRHLGGHIELFDRAAGGDPITEGSQPVAGTILRATFSLPPAQMESIPAPSTALPICDKNELLKGLGILVVEDSPSSRDWLVHSLSHAGARVEGVENGLRALELLKQPEAPQRIDVLLTDMTLPHMNGVELLQHIKSERSKDRLKWNGLILGLTAHIDDKLRETCLRLGMTRLLEKPIRSSALCHAVHCAVHKKTDTTNTFPSKAAATIAAPFSKRAINDLMKQLGQETALGFMARAHEEARSVLHTITSGAQCEETKRLLHAATGSSGLTGLKLLEHNLRQVELSLDGTAAAQQAAIEEAMKALEATKNAMVTLGAKSGTDR